MQQFRPDVKPPMWGPPDAIAFAVRANCDRLGINYAATDGYWPLLERGGNRVLDVVHGAPLTVSGDAGWAPHGVRVYDTANSAITGLSPKINAAATERTCLAWLVNISVLPNSDSRIFANRSTWSDTQGFALETTSSRLRLRHSTLGGRVDITSTVDLREGSGPIVYRKNDPMLFGVAYGPSTCSFYHDAKNVPVDIVAHSSTGIVASTRNFSIGNAIDFLNNLTVAGAFVSHERLQAKTVERLGYEPYTLLMPVARPLYFDLGSVEPGTDVEGPAVITAASTIAASGSKQTASPATVTASASVGMGGVKGAVAPLNIVGSISAEASGIKSTSGPATITATATYGASGIKTIAGLDKEGPAIITAAATVGMGGVKGGVGAAVLSADYAPTAGGTKGATGQAWFAATGEFYAVRGPDEVPITADEIGRAVSLQARNYSAVLAKRNYTARL